MIQQLVEVTDTGLQNSSNASDDNLDRGIVMLWNDGSTGKKAFMGFDDVVVNLL